MLVPGSANPLLLRSAALTGYSISRSLRFNASDSAYLSRTPSSAGNRKTWTWAGWVKRSAIAFSAEQHIWGVTGTTDATYGEMFFGTGDTLRFAVGYNTTYGITTTRVFRDPGAWYHIVLAFDATQSTAANKIRLYINGVEETTFSTDTRSSLANQDWGYNNNVAHYIGRQANSDIRHFNGLIADCYLIDGQALTPSSFGETDATTGVWNPKAYTGSYGTNGFHLEFADNSSTTNGSNVGIGKDTSGNVNYWNSTGLSVTAGAGNDSLVDVPQVVPTNGAQTDTGVGGEVRGNYATLNPLAQFSTGGVTTSDGNLTAVLDRITYNNWVPATFAVPSSGKYYFEVVQTAANGSTTPNIGVGLMNVATPINQQTPSNYRVVRLSTGDKSSEGGNVSYGSGFALNDVCQVAIDVDAGKIWFGKNGTWFSSGNPATGANAAYTDIVSSGYGWFPALLNIYGNNTNTVSVNFGQRAFAYTAPSGFKALCTANLPAPLVTKANTVFDTLLYTGNGATPRAITGLNFSPDLVWTKKRSASGGHGIFDVIRGSNPLASNNTGDETTNAQYGRMSSFDSAGFTVMDGTAGSFQNDIINANGATYAAWCWDAGSTTVTNTQGSITSSVRANPTAGFSVVTWSTNSSSGNATIGHGLNVAPKLIIMKSRNATYNWDIYHGGISNAKDGRLAFTTAAFTTAQVPFGGVDPTSSVFTMSQSFYGTGIDCVAYCFAPVVGYSSFGSYTGNGSSDGPFVYTGFRPRYLLWKSTSSGQQWFIHDAARSSYNFSDLELAAESSAAEYSANGVGAGQRLDFLSNGFKVRTSNAANNASGQTFIYAAFAESPFNYARAR